MACDGRDMHRPDRRPTFASQAAGRDECPTGCGQPYNGGLTGTGHLDAEYDPTRAELECIQRAVR